MRRQATLGVVACVAAACGWAPVALAAEAGNAAVGAGVLGPAEEPAASALPDISSDEAVHLGVMVMADYRAGRRYKDLALAIYANTDRIKRSRSAAQGAPTSGAQTRPAAAEPSTAPAAAPLSERDLLALGVFVNAQLLGDRRGLELGQAVVEKIETLVQAAEAGSGQAARAPAVVLPTDVAPPAETDRVEQAAKAGLPVIRPDADAGQGSGGGKSAGKGGGKGGGNTGGKGRARPGGGGRGG